MKITIENNQVIVNLDEFEFPLFEAMFENLELDKFVRCEYRDFSWGESKGFQKLLPMHLCRTIGEANLSEDPFATITLYPFWKYGSAWPTANGFDQTILPSDYYCRGSSRTSRWSVGFLAKDFDKLNYGITGC